MSLATIIRQTARMASVAGVTVKVDRRMPWVTISTHGQEDIFLEGHEAELFVEACDKLWDKGRTVTMDECYLCEAEQYTILWE